jgi:hypothetical protein
MFQRNRLLACAAAMAAVAVGVFGPLRGAELDPALLRNADLAINHPDEFAWRLFVEICQPAGPQGRQVVWETWADQDHIFANPDTRPIWPDIPSGSRRLRGARQQALRATTDAVPPMPDIREPSGSEEVRDNRPAFDYIVKNELWYREGVLRQAGRPDGIKFPQDAVTIKARWRYIDEAQKPRFHWADYEFDGTKRAVGLVALHVVSKVVPNWHWATFEHVDNPGLADFMGVVDTFGLTPPRIYPQPVPNQGYDGGVLKSELVTLMRNKKLDPAWGFYRLKGSQVDFTDSTGRATVLGNSITEAGFVASSSCITCHARSSANLGRKSVNASTWENLDVFDAQNQSYSGPVSPDWFWFAIPSTDRVARQDLRFYQLDFLWQLAFEPKARAKAVK